jgi:heat shock protein beta
MMAMNEMLVCDTLCRESNAGDAFSIAKDPRGNTLGRGTEITLFLKDDAVEYAQQHRLEEVVKHHSEFITFPIYLYKKTQEVVEESTTSAAAETKVSGDDDDLEVEEEDDEEAKSDGAAKTTKVRTLGLYLVFIFLFAAGC